MPLASSPSDEENNLNETFICIQPFSEEYETDVMNHQKLVLEIKLPLSRDPSSKLDQYHKLQVSRNSSEVMINQMDYESMECLTSIPGSFMQRLSMEMENLSMSRSPLDSVTSSCSTFSTRWTHSKSMKPVTVREKQNSSPFSTALTCNTLQILPRGSPTPRMSPAHSAKSHISSSDVPQQCWSNVWNRERSATFQRTKIHKRQLNDDHKTSQCSSLHINSVPINVPHSAILSVPDENQERQKELTRKPFKHVSRTRQVSLFPYFDSNLMEKKWRLMRPRSTVGEEPKLNDSKANSEEIEFVPSMKYLVIPKYLHKESPIVRELVIPLVHPERHSKNYDAPFVTKRIHFQKK